MSHDHSHDMPAHDHSAGGTTLAIDPVCHMSVDPATAQHVGEYNGTTYYFCAGGCKKAFLADPQRFLTPPPAIQPTGTGPKLLQMAGHGCAGGDSCGCS